MKNYSTGICANCGASDGLHRYDTKQCPKNGREETRFDKLDGKYYPQQYENTIFEDSGLKKLSDAAPDLLEALIAIRNLIDNAVLVRDISKDDDFEYFSKQGFLISHAVELLNNAIKKATHESSRS